MARDPAMVQEIRPGLDRSRSPAHNCDAATHDHHPTDAHGVVDDLRRHAQSRHRTLSLGRPGLSVHTTPHTAQPALDVCEHHRLLCPGHAVWHDLFPARLTSSPTNLTINT